MKSTFCKTWRYCLLLFCLIVSEYLVAQTNASPYSIVGIGDIESSYADHSAGMADVGVSMSSGKYMYHANPASYSALEDHFFMLELSGRLKVSTYVGDAVPLDNRHSSDFQVGKLALGIKPKKFWGASVGLMPYSSSNYSFYNSKYIEGTNYSTLAHYDGTGGLYQFYFGNGFAINKHLSLGVQVAALFGSLIQNETLTTTLLTDSLVTTRNMFLSKLMPKAGFQYKFNLSKKTKVSLGAAATPKTKLNADYTLDVRQGSTDLVTDKTISDTYFTLPFSYDAGASLVYDNKITLAASYSAQQWSDATYTGLGYSLTNSNRMAVGVQYSNQKNMGSYTYENYYVQGGAYYNNTYLIINGKQLTDKGFTLGFGGNAKPNRSTLGYQFTLQIGSKGGNSQSIMKENYTRAGITIYYRDFWSKGKYF